MSKLKLVCPTKEHEQQAKEFIQEFKDNNSNINGSGGLENHANYIDWLEKIDKESNVDTLEPGMIQANTYFVIRESDNCIIGIIRMRPVLNESLLKRGGHLGCSVRPAERKKGYATEMVHLGLEKCSELGINKVLVTCDKSNIGSAKAIQNNFGVLENEIVDEGEVIQRYWIDVKEAIRRKTNLENDRAL